MSKHFCTAIFYIPILNLNCIRTHIIKYHKSDGLIKPSLLTPYNACPHSEQNFAPLIFRYPQFVQNTIPLISKFRVVKEFRFLSTSSAISSALSSSLDCCTIPQICVISTGQKNSIEMIVGIACCPKIPIPASNAIALSLGIKLTFNADFKPSTALNKLLKFRI